jgi:hypothetical protein
MFAVMRLYLPAPPPGVGSPFAWGRRDHLEGLLGGAFELPRAYLRVVGARRA